jgi:hypothetical protein
MGHHRMNNPYVQAIVNPRNRIFSSPVYFDGNVYLHAVGDVLKRFRIVSGRLTGPVDTSRKTFAYPGANLSVSADGSANGIVWSLENSGTRTDPDVAVLHAYDATDIDDELYDSNQSGTRDQPGHAVKFAVPTVANGKVYVGTKTGLTVYGLLD